MSGPKKKIQPHSVKQVRTGGLIGDTSLELMEKYNADGGGVDESDVRDFQDDPNEKRLPTIDGPVQD